MYPRQLLTELDRLVFRVQRPILDQKGITRVVQGLTLDGKGRFKTSKKDLKRGG